MTDQADMATADSEPVKVLVVDDLPEKQLVLETVLSELGPGVATIFASSGDEALLRVLEHDFAVILLDINMPGMDGLETASYIRKRKKSAHTPIIFMTAFADEILTHRGYSLGAVDYILAPINPTVLRTKVGVFVELSRKTNLILRQAEERIALVHEQAARAAAEAATRRSQFLADASKRLAESLDLDQTLANLAQLTVPTLADASCAMVFDTSGNLRSARFYIAASQHKAQSAGEASAEQIHPQLVEIARQAAATRTKVLIQRPPLTLDEFVPTPAQEKLPRVAQVLHALTAYPLTAFGHLVGVVVLATGLAARDPTPAETELTDELMDRGGMALENARLYQDLREADRRKDDFLAMLAHELRNPLAPIRNAAQILRLVETSEPAIITARETIDRQVTHMVRLIDDLLDVSRLSRGKVSLKLETVDVGHLLRSVCNDFRALLEQAGLALQVAIDPQPLWIEGDPARLAQVLANLLQNANKFTNAGGRVEVRAAADRARSVVALQVRDSGIGMEPAMLAKAFEAFSQADRSLDRSRGGLGLGLALVKGLVELHQGNVRAASEGLDHGTTIAIELPLAAAAEAPCPELEVEAAIEGQQRILIVEDNRDAANMLRLLLKMQGSEVEVAYDGTAALRIAAEFAPHIVLCDIGLPGEFNGYGVAESFRQHPQLSTAYLVAVTGYGREEDRQRSRAAGFDAHLTKPVGLKDLTAVLQRQEIKAQ